SVTSTPPARYTPKTSSTAATRLFPAISPSVTLRRVREIEHRDHGPMVAGSELALHQARHRSISNRATGENEIEPPTDVPLLHVPPGRPPREHLRVLGL